MVASTVQENVIQVNQQLVMKKITILTYLFLGTICFVSCSNDDGDTEELSEWECGTYNGNTLYTGPRGGCYYYNSNGNKAYVDRSECNC